LFDDVKGITRAARRPAQITIQEHEMQTPAFVYDEAGLVDAAARISSAVRKAGAKPLFSVKAFAFLDGLRAFMPLFEGASVSSLFEARLARSVLTSGTTARGVHVTTPGLRADEMVELSETADYISFNSLGQFERLRPQKSVRASIGLRVNPQLSFIEDSRYDPCRPFSKLGVPIETLALMSADERVGLESVEGLHFHTNCESMSLGQLLETVRLVDDQLPWMLERAKWINLGGGYQYDVIEDFDPLRQAVELLAGKYGLEVFVEPGEAIVGRSGYIASSVIDLFTSGDRQIAILDTSVNHMPQVFEYQYRADVLGADPSGKHSYVLGGASCLAGDLFGEYAFAEPLKIGSRVVFESMGAYSAVKWHMFNGLNLPNVYALNVHGKLDMKRRYTYEDYMSKWERR